MVESRASTSALVGLGVAFLAVVTVGVASISGVLRPADSHELAQNALRMRLRCANSDLPLGPAPVRRTRSRASGGRIGADAIMSRWRHKVFRGRGDGSPLHPSVTRGAPHGHAFMTRRWRSRSGRWDMPNCQLRAGRPRRAHQAGSVHPRTWTALGGNPRRFEGNPGWRPSGVRPTMVP